MAYTGGDNVNAIVADIGSYSSKLGFAGEDYPKSYFRSTVAILREEGSKNKSVSESAGSKSRRRIDKVHYDYFTRPISLKDDNDGKWQVSNPVDPTTGLWYDGETEGNNSGNSNMSTESDGADWCDLMQHLIRHGYESALGTTTEEFPLLLVERSYNPPPIRQQVLECLMEELNVPAAFLGRDATMACYATGRTTGTVVDVGYGGTVVTPVYDGYVEQKGIRRSPMAGLAMDEQVLETLDTLASKPFMPLYQVRRKNHVQRADPFHRLSRLDVARQAKEMGAGAAVASAADTANSSSHQFKAPHIAYQLPDGQEVNVPAARRFAVPDLLFGSDDVSVQQREDAVADHQKKYAALLANASHAEDDANTEENEKHKEKYNESTAVGMSSRRNKKKRSKTVDKSSKDSKGMPLFSNQHLQRACVPYLQNQLEQITASAVPGMVCDAAFRCDRDQQASLLGNVVLCGGGACLGPTDQAVPDLLREQVEGIIHTHTPGWRVKVLSPNVQERAICSWLGGSILGSMGTFHDMWITRTEYEEWGSAIVNRKCP